MNAQFVRIISIILQLIFLEGILSIDNAVVLGALVSHLPKDDPIPWPAFLKKHVHIHAHRLLGNQQQAALKVGLFGAYVGRGLMLFLATFIVENPWLKLLGALYLLKIAFENLGEASMGPQHHGVDGEHESGLSEKLASKAQKGFWSVVLVVELSDLIFSLDNVVAAVAISDEFWVVFIGVAIGVLIMRFAAGIFALLVEKEPILISSAYILIMNIGIELIVEDFAHIEIGDVKKFTISVLTVLITLAYAHVPVLQKTRPVLVAIGKVFWHINYAVSKPFNLISNTLKKSDPKAHLFKPHASNNEQQ